MRGDIWKNVWGSGCVGGLYKRTIKIYTNTVYRRERENLESGIASVLGFFGRCLKVKTATRGRFCSTRGEPNRRRKLYHDVKRRAALSHTHAHVMLTTIL